MEDFVENNFDAHDQNLGIQSDADEIYDVKSDDDQTSDLLLYREWSNLEENKVKKVRAKRDLINNEQELNVFFRFRIGIKCKHVSQNVFSTINLSIIL